MSGKFSQLCGGNEQLLGRKLGDWLCQLQLGTGSFGIVHVWRNTVTEETVALKKCRFASEVMMSEKHKEQWKQEVDIMLRLDHPNVVECKPAPAQLIEGLVRSSPAGGPGGGVDELPLLCMEYCSGGDLRKVLNQPKNCSGLSQVEVMAVTSDIASALGFLHNRRIIHRDLKPENVVLQEGGDRIVYKLIDLGYAKELGMSSLALSFVGTLQYIAPELFLSQTYSKSVDYWSLGFITHEIVTGHRPFLPNMSPGQWMEHVQTKSLEDICIYQDVFTGKITKSRTFFPEHQLDGSVAEELQVWLRSLLKWDSNNRGKDEHGQVCVFSQLGDILSKIRIQVVSMDFGIHGLDFVVGEASTGQDLQQHVERASGLAPANQLILGSSGCEIHASHALHPIFDRTSEDCRVFVFDRLQVRKDPGQQIRCLKLSIPTSIQPFLAKPRLEVTYPEKKLIYSHAVHFTKQENQMSHLFGLGLKVLVLYLLNKTKEVNVASQIVGKTFERVSAKVELFQESLFHDKEKYLEQSKRKDHITSAQIFDSWHTAERDVAHHVSRLNETKLMADNLLKNVNILAVDVQKSKSELMQQQEDMNLQDFVDKSILRFESLKKIPVEGRKEKDSVMEVAQIIVKCLKQRDRNLQRHFCLRGKLFEMYAALQTLQPEQTMAQQVMESVSNMVSKLQRKRQSDIWKLLAAAVQQKEASPVTTSNAMAGKMFEAFQEASKVVANQNDSLRRQLADMTEQANPYLNPL